MKGEYDEECPALVFGTGITVLGTIRCLGSAGIPLHCASVNPDIERHSRWYRALPKGCSSISSVEELESFLRKLPFQQAVLIPCSDDWCLATAKLPADLSERYRVSQPSLEVQSIMVDKGKFRSILQETDIPHPRTFEFENEFQLKQILEELRPEEVEHFFLKPCDSLSFCRRFVVKAFSFDGIEDALVQYRRARVQGFDMLLQEFIPGPASNHFYVEGFIDQNGEIKTTCTRQRLRMYPPRYGNSSTFQSIESSAISPAVDCVKKLLRTLEYRGIFSAELKRDDRDGTYKLLEVNSRCWWYVEFPNRCGVNIPEMAFRDSLDLNVAQVHDYKVGVKAVYPYLDIPAGLGEIRARQLSFVQWLVFWWGAKFTVWTISDPMPALAWFVSKVQKVVLGLFGYSQNGKSKPFRFLSRSS